jgi:hypothetical protein
VQVYFTTEFGSAALKDEGVRYCSQELVAVLEADCLPGPGWLRTLTEAMTSDPYLGAVSSLTLYEGQGSLRPVMSLLDRAFILQEDGKGQFQHVANNGALYRKSVLRSSLTPRIPARSLVPSGAS